MVAQPDMLITGDMDFYTPEIQEHFTIMTPDDFLTLFLTVKNVCNNLYFTMDNIQIKNKGI